MDSAIATGHAGTPVVEQAAARRLLILGGLAGLHVIEVRPPLLDALLAILVFRIRGAVADDQFAVWRQNQGQYRRLVEDPARADLVAALAALEVHQQGGVRARRRPRA